MEAPEQQPDDQASAQQGNQFGGGGGGNGGLSGGHTVGGAGGGGGSSYSSGTSTIYTTGYQSGDGYVEIPSPVKIWNNIIYDYTGTGDAGVYWNDVDWAPYIYSNTIVNSSRGLDRGNDSGQYTKNNLISATDAFNGTFITADANNDYNSISENTNDPAIGSHGKYNRTISFVDATNKNFHLASTDPGAAAIGLGTDLSVDPVLPFAFDIDNQRRGNTWDIGADENNYHNTQVQETHEVNLTNGLVLYQSFDGPFMDWSQTSAQARDKSGLGNNGAAMGSLSQSSVRLGKLGQALSFNGSSDSVSTPNSLGTSNTAFSVTTWFKTSDNAGSSYDVIVGKEGAGTWYNGEWQVDTYGNSTDNGLRFYVYSGGSSHIVAIDTNNIFDGNWHQVTAVASASSLVLYLDGTQVATDPTFTLPNQYNDDIWIGARKDSGNHNYFNGQIDEVRVYNRALSPSEVTSLYRLGGEKVNMSLTNKMADSSLVGLWTFDGPDVSWGSSLAYDRSPGGTNTGTIYNKSSVQPGKRGQALNFNGSSTYVSVANSSSLDLPNQLTLASWVYNTSRPDREPIIDNGLSGNYCPSYDLSILASGVLSTFVYSGGSGQHCTPGFNVNSTGTVPLNSWTHIVTTYDGSNVKFYINGVLDSTVSAGGSFDPYTPIHNLWIGGEDGYTRRFHGNIDEVRIYSRALSAGEVMSLYRMGGSKLK